MSESAYLVLMIILSLVERTIFGCITSKINSCKGRDGGFAWGFFLCGIGIIVTATRPSLINQEASCRENYPDYLAEHN